MVEKNIFGLSTERIFNSYLNILLYANEKKWTKF